MQGNSWRVLLFASIVALGTPHALAQGVSPTTETQRYAGLTTAMEAAVGTSLLLSRRTGAAKVEWFLQMSERSWRIDLKGDAFGCRITGYLWEDTPDWLVSFAGTGDILGKDPIYINGKAQWLYDKQSADHRAMDFQIGIKFGDRSAWYWIRASEVIVGGAIAGGGTFAFITFGSAGTGAPAAIPWGIAAAGFGGSAAIALSDFVEYLSENGWVAPPAAPSPPALPQAGAKFEPGTGKIAIAVPKVEGQVFASAGSDFVLSGSVTGDVGTGVLLRR